MKKLINKYSTFVALILLLAVGGITVSKFRSTTAPSPPILPNSNGYDDFVKAGQMLQEPLPNGTNFCDMKVESLRSIVDSNAEALRLARQGLDRQCQVRAVADKNGHARHMNNLHGIRRVAIVLVCHARLLELEQKTNAAATAYWDVVKFSHEASRGGLIIDALFGLACEGLATQALRPTVRSLDAQTCRKLARSMEEEEARRETADEVLANEQKWVRQTWTWQRFLLNLYYERALTPEKKTRNRFREQMGSRILEARQLMLDLAARAYELENGHPPGNASDLLPDYLRAIPPNPANGTNHTSP